MPDSPLRRDQPGGGEAAGRGHARPGAGDQPARPFASGPDAEPGPASGSEAGAAAGADAAGSPTGRQRPAGTAPQDAPDSARQREAATPGPERPPAAAERLATLPLRLLAFAVDVACVVVVLLPLMLVGALAGVGSLGLFVLVVAACLVTYLTVWVWLTGQTIGKALFGLTVRRVGNSAPAHTWRALAWSLGRHSVGYLIADVFGLGILLALTPSRRCLHDYAFGSKVVIDPADGGQRRWSPLAQLEDFDKRLDASIEDRGRRYARLVSLWKKLAKLLRYPALLVVVLAGKNSESQLGKVWAWVQRQISRLMAHAQSTPARPATAWTGQARAVLWAVTAGATATIAVTIGPVLTPSHPPPRPPGTEKLTATIGVGIHPDGVAAGEGAVWVANNGSGSVSRIDPATNKVTATIPVGTSPSAVAAGEGAVWVANYGSGSVSRIDPATSRVTATIRVGEDPDGVAAGEGAVWVANYGSGSVSRIDPATNKVTATIPDSGSPEGVAAGQGAVWVANYGSGSVSRIDPATNKVTATIPVGGSPDGVAAGEGAVWVANIGSDSVSRIDPATNKVTATIPVGDEAHEVTVDRDVVWVTKGYFLFVPVYSSLSRIDPVTNKVTATIHDGIAGATAVAADQGAVWVANFDNGSVSRIDY